MKRAVLLWLLVATAVLSLVKVPVFAQESKPQILFDAFPLHGDGVASAKTAVVGTAAAQTLPLWSYATVAGRDGKSYHGTLVGRSPFFHGARTTYLDTILIPVKITITNSFRFTQTFDPTQPDPQCLPNGSDSAATLVQASPILMPASFTMNGVDEGVTQYVDAFDRAAFFEEINDTGDRYHTLLNLTNTLAPISLTFKAPTGAIFNAACGNLGVININVLDKMVISSILPSLAAQGVGPTTLPVFLLYNIAMTVGPPNQRNPGRRCCILGYHSGTGKLPNPQFYAVADYDSTASFTDDEQSLDTDILSHETAELINDPMGNNLTPKWGHIGQVSGCQNNLEVGDPLSGTFFPSVTMPNGVTYHLQELAFYSWFFGAPSIGAGGLYSDNGTFAAPAARCP